jgi:tRNA(Ile)-lysidine synthetase, N-terminal domain/tRNA(Ile)-lysidine synthetase, C-terminal domain
MENKIKENILNKQLLEKYEHVLVGLSGGADSIALVNILLNLKEELEIEVSAIHINHGIREKEADEDEQFCREFCKKKQIKFYSKKVDVNKYAIEHALSSEEAGRLLRYKYFEDCKKDIGASKIATAHHMDDSAETILFNLFRGTGISGISGITRNYNNIIRPLLIVTRQEIENYLMQNNISFRTDSTNLTDMYTRNKIRRNILAYARENINPKATEHICNLADDIEEILDLINCEVENFLTEYAIIEQTRIKMPIESLLKTTAVIRKEIIRKSIASIKTEGLKNIKRSHILSVERLIFGQSGKSLEFTENIQIKRVFENLIIELINNDEIKIEETKFNVKNVPLFEMSVFEYKKNDKIPKNTYTKWFDYDKISGMPIIRTKQEGDYIAIKGGHKKIKRCMIEHKIPSELRAEIPVVAYENHVIWLVGYRISESVKIDINTKKILQIKYSGGL